MEPKRPARILAGLALLVVAFLAATALFNTAPPDEPATVEVAPDTPVRQPAPLAAGVDLDAWASGVADRTGVPQRALRAYGNAELVQRRATPDCRLSWATLAGVGRVESHHGGLGESRLEADGVARPNIIGLPLDGSGQVREVRDTDRGKLDGDPTYDRAVGPMQFLPATWARYGADGNGDGLRDPQQIDDAARASARFLCSQGRDTASGEGWWDGVLAYNASHDYARDVWAATDRYTAAAQDSSSD